MGKIKSIVEGQTDRRQKSNTRIEQNIRISTQMKSMQIESLDRKVLLQEGILTQGIAGKKTRTYCLSIQKAELDQLELDHGAPASSALANRDRDTKQYYSQKCSAYEF